MSKTKLKILMSEFAMYLANDTGAENDEHEKWINKFVDFIDKEIIGDNEKYEPPFDLSIGTLDTRNRLRREQREKLHAD